MKRGARRPAEPSEPTAELVELGVVVGAHGLRGELHVRLRGDDPGNLLRAREVWLARPGAEPSEVRAGRREVHRASPGRPGEARLALAGVTDRDAAAALRGRRVLVRPEVLAPLAEGEFYWHQLVGCRVEDQDGAPLGTVVELWDTGAHDVLVVAGPDGRRHLIPTAREIVREIDPEARRIRVEVFPGLLD